MTAIIVLRSSIHDYSPIHKWLRLLGFEEESTLENTAGMAKTSRSFRG